MIWSGIQRFGTMGISFISNMVLARLLTPEDFGCIGMLAIFITVSNTFVDGGFGSALIQKKEPTQSDYSTVFWWNLFLSLTIYCILYACAPAISRFYRIPLLSSVLRVQGIVLIINALNIIQSNQLRKRLNFRRLASIVVVSQLVGVIVAILMALDGWGVWALVAQQIVASSMTSLLLWILNRWMPDLCFSMESFKQLFGFGSFILSSNLINTFCNNIQGLLIGRFFTPAIMGYYTQAHKLETVASHSFTSIIDQVSYPVLSRFQSDNNALKKAIYKLVSSLVYVSFPLMSLLILEANPIISLVYGEKWIQSIPYFQILCVAGMSATFHGVHYYAVACKGESRDLFIGTVVKRVLALLVLVLGMSIWGVKGLLWGFSLGAWIISIVNMHLVSKHVGYTIYQQFKDLLPIIILSIITFCITYSFLVFLNGYGCWSYLLALALYVSLYIGLSVIFKIRAFQFLKETIRDYLQKIL